MPAISGCEKRCWKNQRKCPVTWQDAFVCLSSSSLSSFLHSFCPPWSVVKTNAKSAASNWLQKVKKTAGSRKRSRRSRGRGGEELCSAVRHSSKCPSLQQTIRNASSSTFYFPFIPGSALRITFAVSGSHAATPPTLPMRKPKTTKALLEQ